VTTNSLFGTSGIRGDAEDLFTNQFSFDLGQTFALFLDHHKQKGGVAVGMDPRGSSPRIKDAVISGLVYQKREVYDQGAAPVPSMCYIQQVSEKYVGAVMISGSHIKPHLNGIKFFAFNEEILKSHEAQINKIYKKVAGKTNWIEAKEDEIHPENTACEEYIERLINLASDPLPKWKVVVDPGDGAQSDVMPKVLERLGLNIIEINATIQGEFYARDTEVENDFDSLKETVIKENADFGVGYDSDGDRVIFVDKNGNFIPGDYTGTLIAREVISSTVVTPINTSQVIDRIDKRIIRTKVGSPYVVEKMKEHNLDFGFEANGGGIFRDMLSRDGGRTTIEIMNLMKTKNKDLISLVNELPRFYLFREKLDYKWEYKELILRKAKEEFKGWMIEETDGLKIWLDETTWILFRSSMNAPEFRVFAESNNRKKARQTMEKGLNLVKEVIKSG